MNAERKAMIKKLVISCLVIAAIVGVGYLIMHLLGWTKLTQEELQEYINSTGAIAPLIYIGVSFLQVTFVPIPGSITILAGNYLFGTGLAFLYSYIGMFIGALFAFFLGRIIGRPFVNWVAGSKEKVDEWLAKLKGRENVLLFFMFFFPFFPDDILCSIAGILKTTWFEFIIMQVITRATSIAGTLFFMSGQIIPFEGWGLVILGIVAVIFVAAFIVCFKNAEKINGFFDRLIDKLFKRKKEN